jgi:hypothetical protein
MDVKLLKLILKSQKGQSIIEFIIFLPFLLMLYTISLSITNAINGSLNQQKVTRAYFYYTLQNNSTFPRPYRDEGAQPYNTWTQFGMQIMGWTEKLINQVPVMTCYKFKLPLGNKAGDECENGYNEKTTQFIRIGTVYGACGATYMRNQGEFHRLPTGGVADPSIVSSGQSCFIMK